MNSENQTKLRVLIIEDEPFAQQELKRLLALVSPEIEILDYIDSIEDSILWFAHNPHPDLVFMDIQLSDGLSFEIFKSAKIQSPVIFTTAFDEYAIRAFKVNSIDYLLKPIDLKDIKAAIDKFEKIRNHYAGYSVELKLEQIEKLVASIRPKTEYKSRFIAKSGDQIKYINASDIAYFFADDTIVFMVTENYGKYIVEYSLNELEAFVDPKFFYRINRTYIAHIKSIVKVHKFFNSRLKIELKPPVEDHILVSRVKVPGFLSWMES